MSKRDPYEDRAIPTDLFMLMFEGRIDADEAQRRARARWEAEDARGYTANDLVRDALYGRRDAQQGKYQRRNKQGQFVAGDEEPDMNAMIRAAARGVPTEQGTITTSDGGVQ